MSEKCPKCGAPFVAYSLTGEEVAQYKCGTFVGCDDDGWPETGISESAECLRRQLARAKDQIGGLRVDCKALLEMCEHGGPVHIPPGHSCGTPNAVCDCDCVAAAQDAVLMVRARKTLRETEPKA